MEAFTKNKRLAAVFIIPQIVITLIFFIAPACGALKQSMYYLDAFGLHQRFAGLGNYIDLFIYPSYLQALWVTAIMVLCITLLTMGLGLLMAVLVAKRTRSQNMYKSLLIWPYAIAPAVAAILWRFLCHPTQGWLTQLLQVLGINFDYVINPQQALLVIVLTASWQHFSYNFLFYYAALKAVPAHLIEAAIMDGASTWQRFRHVIVPILSPTTFFLLFMNIIYGFFDTFGIIQVITHGGPGNTTTNLMYKVYKDGMEAMDLGSAAAQSILMMLVVVLVSIMHFNYLDKKVHYQ